LKVDASRREVHGVMAEEAKDRSGETFDYVSSKPYVLQWSKEIEKTTDGKSLGNVRGQHGKIAAGKLVSITFDDAARRIPVVAKIVDNNEWEKVVAGVYTGFSIGGSYVKKWEDGGATRYTAKPAEVSLVDHPCMYGATFQMVKADGAFEYRGFAGAPSNQSGGMAELRQRIIELGKVVEAYVARRAAAQPTRFNTNGREVEKSDIVAQELEKALANGKPVTFETEASTSARFQTVESIGVGVRTAPGGRFVPDGFEKNDVAAEELNKALARPIRIG
jgi:hypothetical protein